MVKPKIIIVTQARIGSTRFPEKILQTIEDNTLLSIHLRRLKKSTLANKIIVATTFEEKSYLIKDIAIKEGAFVFQGSINDVLDRFYQAVKKENAQYIVRVTSDCPLIDASIVDQVINMVIEKNLDYGSNTLIEDFPDGQDVEVIKFDALEKAWKESKLTSEREHVTPYIRNNSTFFNKSLFRSDNFDAPVSMNHIRMTVDEPVDLEAIRILVNELGINASWEKYASYIENNTRLFKNQNITRNEGYLNSINKERNENR